MHYYKREGFTLIEIEGITNDDIQKIQAFLTNETIPRSVTASYGANGDYKPNTGRFCAFFEDSRLKEFVDWLHSQGITLKQP